MKKKKRSFHFSLLYLCHLAESRPNKSLNSQKPVLEPPESISAITPDVGNTSWMSDDSPGSRASIKTLDLKNTYYSSHSQEIP